MPSNADLLHHLREMLIDEGIVRRPPVVDDAYPMFIQPDGGAPAPGEKEPPENDDEMILTIMDGGDIPSETFLGHIRRATVDLYFRTAKGKTPDAMDLEPQINALIVDKWAWDMAGLFVLESKLWAGMQQVRNAPGDGTTWVVKFYFEIYRD